MEKTNEKAGSILSSIAHLHLIPNAVNVQLNMQPIKKLQNKPGTKLQLNSPTSIHQNFIMSRFQRII